MAIFFTDVFEFTAAVRGFHEYRKVWRPKEGQLLNCYFEKNNSFDPFAIKVCDQETNKIVGHLPREISRITKFLLDRNAVVTTELTSSHYRRSPLVQGGLEIRSKVTVKVDSSFNTKVFDRYKAKVKELYIEPTEEEILGSFLLEEESASTSRKSVARNGGNINKKRKSQKSADTPQQEEPRCKDIRNFFTHTRNVKSKSNQGQGKNIIEID